MKKIFTVLMSVIFVFSSLCIVSASENLQVTVGNHGTIDIENPAEITVSAGAGFEGATLSVEGVTVYEITETGSGTYSITDADFSNVTVIGKTNLLVEGKFSGNTESVSVPVTLAKIAEPAIVVNENFSKLSSATTDTLGFPLVNPVGTTLSAYNKGNDDCAVKFETSSSSGSPYINRADSAPKDSIITFSVDMLFGENTNILMFEFLNANKKTGINPTIADENKRKVWGWSVVNSGKFMNGDALTIETWYNFKIVINSITQGVDIYAKGGDYAEYTNIYSEYNYYLEGLSSVRTNYRSKSKTAGYCLIDNYSISYESAIPYWFASGEFADENGGITSAENVSVKGAKMKIKFSEAMKNVTASDIKVLNEVGDEIEFTGEYNGADCSFTLTNVSPLRYDSKYYIHLSETLIAEKGATRFTDVPISFKTQKNAVSIESAIEGSGKVTVTVANYENIQEGMILAAVCYKNGDVIDVNFFKINAQQGVYDLAVTKADSSCEIGVFLIESTSRIAVKDAHP